MAKRRKWPPMYPDFYVCGLETNPFVTLGLAFKIIKQKPVEQLVPQLHFPHPFSCNMCSRSSFFLPHANPFLYLWSHHRSLHHSECRRFRSYHGYCTVHVSTGTDKQYPAFICPIRGKNKLRNVQRGPGPSAQAHYKKSLVFGWQKRRELLIDRTTVRFLHGCLSLGSKWLLFGLLDVSKSTTINQIDITKI